MRIFLILTCDGLLQVTVTIPLLHFILQYMCPTAVSSQFKTIDTFQLPSSLLFGALYNLQSSFMHLLKS